MSWPDAYTAAVAACDIPAAVATQGEYHANAQELLLPVVFENFIHLADAREICEIIFNIHDNTIFLASDRWPSQASTNHLAIQNHGSRRSSKENTVNFWSIKSGRQDLVIA